MRLEYYGYTTYSGCPIHLRLNDNEAPGYSSVCSCTSDFDSNKWKDSALDGHWGNSLFIYIK